MVIYVTLRIAVRLRQAEPVDACAVAGCVIPRSVESKKYETARLALDVLNLQRPRVQRAAFAQSRPQCRVADRDGLV
jgi:hypothetical protein